MYPLNMKSLLRQKHRDCEFGAEIFIWKYDVMLSAVSTCFSARDFIIQPVQSKCARSQSKRAVTLCFWARRGDVVGKHDNGAHARSAWTRKPEVGGSGARAVLVSPSGAPGRPRRSKVNVFEIVGTSVSVVPESGADEVGQAGAGVVLSLPREGDLGGEARLIHLFTHSCTSQLHLSMHNFYLFA